MRALLTEYLPHAPNIGLYVAPDIPESVLRNAQSGYASDINLEEVVALYDATLLQSGKDGTVFLPDRMIYQNNDLEAVQIIRYADIVGVERKRKWLGGAKVMVQVNQGRATVEHTIDFSGKKKAAPYVTRFLQEAMVRAPEVTAREEHPTTSGSDIPAVRAALEKLVARGDLTETDFERIIEMLRR